MGKAYNLITDGFEFNNLYTFCSTFNNKRPIRSTLETDGCQQQKRANRVDKLEHVQLKIKLTAARRGAVKLTLISPAGTRWVLKSLLK